jgi:ribosome-associated protein
MDIRKLQRAIVDGLEDVKAQGIAVFNTEALSPLFERVIIATGASNRQTKALAASVRDAVRSRDMQVMRIEGEENGEWIIVDCGAAVVHIMQPAIREYYHLEEIWGGKPVKMKLGEAQGTRLVKASEEPPHAAGAAVSARYLGPSQAPAAAAAASRKTPAKKAPTKKAPAKNAPARRATAPKAPTRKAPAKQAATKAGAAKQRPATQRGDAAPAGTVRKLVVGAAAVRKSPPARPRGASRKAPTAGGAQRTPAKAATPKRRP